MHPYMEKDKVSLMVLSDLGIRNDAVLRNSCSFHRHSFVACYVPLQA